MKGIYKITNPIGKIYIGQSKNINFRWSQYRRAECKAQHLLYKSFFKYGYDNHTFEVLEECDNLNERESYWIEYFNSKVKGLNADFSQKDVNRFYSKEARQAKSKAMKKHHAEKTINRKWEKKIINNETQIIYNSIKEAMIQAGVGKKYSYFYKNVGEGKKWSYI